jgi:hypothetical protein
MSDRLGKAGITMKIHCRSAVVILTAAFLLMLITAGCTQLERDGLSPIPQNSPGGWEMNPYGDFRN